MHPAAIPILSLVLAAASCGGEAQVFGGTGSGSGGADSGTVNSTSSGGGNSTVGGGTPGSGGAVMSSSSTTTVVVSSSVTTTSSSSTAGGGPACIGECPECAEAECIGCECEFFCFQDLCDATCENAECTMKCEMAGGDFYCGPGAVCHLENTMAGCTCIEAGGSCL